MAALRDIIAFFCKNYPHKAELSKARLTKMVYLSDWKSAIERKRQISDIKWVYNHYGPYVDDVANAAQTDPVFEIEAMTNFYGSNKEVVRLKSDRYEPNLTNAEKEILAYIIAITSTKYWNPFMELVYSTYPILKSQKYSELDLIALAKEYTNQQSL